MAEKYPEGIQAQIKVIRSQEKKALFNADRCLKEAFFKISTNEDETSIEYERKRLAVDDKSSAENLFALYVDNLRITLLNTREKRITALKEAGNQKADILKAKKRFLLEFKKVTDSCKKDINKEADRLEISTITAAVGIDAAAEEITRDVNGAKNVVVNIEPNFVEGYSQPTNREVPKILQPK